VLELEAGNWQVAKRYFQAAEELAFDANSRWDEEIMVSLAGLIATLRGRVRDARRLASKLVRLSFRLSGGEHECVAGAGSQRASRRGTMLKHVARR
jgi:hypothetical protein